MARSRKTQFGLPMSVPGSRPLPKLVPRSAAGFRVQPPEKRSRTLQTYMKCAAVGCLLWAAAMVVACYLLVGQFLRVQLSLPV